MQRSTWPTPPAGARQLHGVGHVCPMCLGRETRGVRAHCPSTRRRRARAHVGATWQQEPCGRGEVHVCVCVCVHTPVTVQACTHRDGSSRCRQPRTGAARSRGALAGLPRDAGAGVALTRVAFSCPRATPSGLVPEQAGNGLLVTRRGFARQAGISYKRPRRTRESFRWAPVTQELQQFSPGHETFLPVAQFLTEC